MTSVEGAEARIEAVLRAAGLQAASVAQVIGHGMSGDLVFRVFAGGRLLFGKMADPGRPSHVAELAREVGMLRWLDGRAGAARLAWAGEAEGAPAMLTWAIDGVPLHELAPHEAEGGARAALRALASLHALPAAACPFDERLEAKLARARSRIEAGEVDAADFEPENRGRPVAEVWADLAAQRPADEDLVVTHGDACWPNLILQPDGRIGMVDLGRGGVADRAQDLALFIRSARHNFPDLPIEDIVRRAYSPGVPDAGKLAFYRGLDEFF